jgi:hypothetical protein
VFSCKYDGTERACVQLFGWLQGDVAVTSRTTLRLNPNLPDRRSFLAAGMAASALVVARPGRARSEDAEPPSTAAKVDLSFELSELTIDELHEGMKSGKFTARSLVEKYLQRIEAIDAGGPTLADRL